MSFGVRDVVLCDSKGIIHSSRSDLNPSKMEMAIAMANPVPEIMPDLARKAGARVVATGRSDFPNQVNNVLGFPGIFRGASTSGRER